jgi:O-antigen/teichoic acid export membrane protein
MSDPDPIPKRSRGLASIAVRNAGMAAIARVSSVIVSIGLTPFILRGLGRDLYGIMTTVNSVFEYLVLLRGGLGSAMRRHVTIRVHTGKLEEARRHYQAGFWWGIILRIPILIAGILLAEPICRFVHLPAELIPDASRGVLLLIIATWLSDAGAILEVPTYSTGETSALSAIRGATQLARIPLILIGFHLLAPTLTLYGWIVNLIMLLSLVALGILAQRARVVGPAVPAPGLGDRSIRRELFSYGGMALLGQGAALLYVTTDNLLIGRIYGAAAVTLYSLGARWLPLIRGFMLSLVEPLTPLFTRLEAEAPEERTRAATCRVVAITSALAVPVCLVPCVLGDLFLTSWVGKAYGDKEYLAAYPILIASLAPLVLEISLAPVWTVLQGRGHIGWVSAGDLVVALGNVAVSVVLAVPLHMGILGFALGNTIALLAKNLLLRPLAGRRNTALPPMGRLFLLMGRAILGGLPALALLFATRRLYGGSLFGVITAGVIGGALCLAGSSLAAIGRAELRELMRTVLPKAARGA